MKIVINKCFGGLGFSRKLFDKLGIPWPTWCHDDHAHIRNEDLGIVSEDYEAFRTDPRLIQAIEELGEKESSGKLAKVHIIEIPDGIQYEIDEYDGVESVEEIHRSWS
jgi:hypothetical protein